MEFVTFSVTHQDALCVSLRSKKCVESMFISEKSSLSLPVLAR